MLIQQMLKCRNPMMPSLSSNMLLLRCPCTTAHQIQLNPACCGYFWIRWSQKHILSMGRTRYIGNINA